MGTDLSLFGDIGLGKVRIRLRPSGRGLERISPSSRRPRWAGEFSLAKRAAVRAAASGFQIPAESCRRWMVWSRA